MIARPITLEDKAIFFELCKNFYDSGATHRDYDENITEKTFSYLMSKHENLWGCILYDDELDRHVGYALVTSYWCNEDGGNVIILDELYVEQSYRHHGYGQQFLMFLEKEFHDKAVSITLEVVTTNTAAKSLYSKLGFTEDGFEVLTKKL